MVIGSLNRSSPWGWWNCGRFSRPPWNTARFLARDDLEPIARTHGTTSWTQGLYSPRALPGITQWGPLVERMGRNVAPGHAAFQVLTITAPEHPTGRAGLASVLTATDHDEPSALQVENLLREAELPAGLDHVRTTDTFDHDHHPAGLRRAHRVAEGIWARLVVHTGGLDFVFDDDPDCVIDVRAGASVVIPPGRFHHVDIAGPLTFALEFHREHGYTDPDPGSESSGLAGT